MIIGIPKEIKNHEYRVGATPKGVAEMIKNGHQVLIEKNAGLEIDFTNEQYQASGAKIIDSAKQIYQDSTMILKVKEPQAIECEMIKKNQIIFSYLHLAAERELTQNLIKSGCSAIAFETITDNNNSLPLLAPMSEVAGKISIQAGAKALEKSQGGRGILLGGVPGVGRAHILILGGGVAGTNAAKVAIGMGAHVTILDKSLARIRYLCDIFGNDAEILYSNQQNITDAIQKSDLIIGAVLVAGSSAPKLINKDDLKLMKKGAVLVDIAIDQGGCFATSKPTSHSQPTFIVDGIVHYCVTNMPGAVPRTSTQALENSTLPFTIEIANKGLEKALAENHHLKNGLNIHQGKITHAAVAQSLNL
jgi:alanine dehydrogenase